MNTTDIDALEARNWAGVVLRHPDELKLMAGRSVGSVDWNRGMRYILEQRVKEWGEIELEDEQERTVMLKQLGYVFFLGRRRSWRSLWLRKERFASVALLDESGEMVRVAVTGEELERKDVRMLDVVELEFGDDGVWRLGRVLVERRGQIAGKFCFYGLN